MSSLITPYVNYLSTSQFNWHPEQKTLTIDLSSIDQFAFGRLWDDTDVEGFWIKSTKRLQLRAFVESKTLYNLDNELTGWLYVPAEPELFATGLIVIVYND